MLRRMKVLLCCSVLAFPVSASEFWPEGVRESYFAILGDYVVANDSAWDPFLDQSYGLDLRYGVRPNTGLPYEFRAFYDVLKGNSGFEDLNRYGVGADLLYPFAEVSGVSPYALAGLGVVRLSGGGDSETDAMANIGAGVMFAPAWLWNTRLRGELRYVYENYVDGFFDLHAKFGVELPFGGPAAPAEEPVRVVTAAAVAKDSDGDGVPDDRDSCPDTPRGAKVDASGCPPAKVLTLKGVTFEVNSDRLRSGSTAVLDQAAETLTREYPKARIEVAGHSDNTGDAQYNLELSRRRAEAVRAYLIERGVEAARLTAIGYGQTEPVAGNDTAEGRAQNRRVELRVRGK